MTPRGHISIGNFRECFSELPLISCSMSGQCTYIFCLLAGDPSDSKLKIKGTYVYARRRYKSWDVITIYHPFNNIILHRYATEIPSIMQSVRFDWITSHLTYRSRVTHIYMNISTLVHHWFKWWLVTLFGIKTLWEAIFFLSMRPYGINFSETWIKVQQCSFTIFCKYSRSNGRHFASVTMC